ncbi:hypothetical protein JOD43_000548 [Pullulanibacillus pueri]|uniref:Uncharacterized protein n=1 Tax=Pullulanibacillus pueri TaxID=1437324 RepID=A0A8J3EK97_9BACL|nr:hypothetical protein [Pullulanibacillus pueri]GGH75312.1 hypothetical protein GCM10007096_04410 [Pullulanibacillus pueri]
MTVCRFFVYRGKLFPQKHYLYDKLLKKDIFIDDNEYRERFLSFKLGG